MTARIFRSIFAVALAVVMAALFIIMGVMSEYYNSVQLKQLTAQTELAARGVSREGVDYLDGLSVAPYRLTWIAADGSVLADSARDPAEMENHLDREEVKEALQSGTGESHRYSTTLAEKTLYRALRLPDGSVIRVSVDQYTVVTLLMGMIQPILIVLVIAGALSALLAHRLAKRIVRPLNALDLDNPTETEAYEELAPLLSRIERQHLQINRQLGDLRRARDEFAAVTNGMSEGLILLNESGTILSINPAAHRLFPEAYIGREMAGVDPSPTMRRLIGSALQGGHDEAVEERDGVVYQFDANPISSDGVISGAVVLAFDVTQKALAEQQRREFSANVSHELKTPLQSIMGSAELLENGLVKDGDAPRFIARIRSEAGRLVTLIDDIIRLSQLDEGFPSAPPLESLSLLSAAREVADSLADVAGRAGVELCVRGDDAEVEGVSQMIREMIYNLCDNAVKYNRPGGRVDVTVGDRPEAVSITVSDTGIGIPPEHQGRVFERFYRVDKSHSKETGGTGLGLSIVKHAAQYHKAALRLTSAPGKGTTISVSFPKNM